MEKHELHELKVLKVLVMMVEGTAYTARTAREGQIGQGAKGYNGPCCPWTCAVAIAAGVAKPRRHNHALCRPFPQVPQV